MTCLDSMPYFSYAKLPTTGRMCICLSKSWCEGSYIGYSSCVVPMEKIEEGYKALRSWGRYADDDNAFALVSFPDLENLTSPNMCEV